MARRLQNFALFDGSVINLNPQKNIIGKRFRPLRPDASSHFVHFFHIFEHFSSARLLCFLEKLIKVLTVRNSENTTRRWQRRRRLPSHLDCDVKKSLKAKAAANVPAPDGISVVEALRRHSKLRRRSASRSRSRSKSKSPEGATAEGQAIQELFSRRLGPRRGGGFSPPPGQ